MPASVNEVKRMSVKKVRSILSAMMFCLSAVSMAGTNRALVVCVGNYPEGNGWQHTSASMDRVLVEEMLHRNGFLASDIRVIQDSQATASSLRKALRSLAGECRPGDNVYIHFSCHGQQITDLDGDEPDGWDEALIPYDALSSCRSGYHGENHLLDDEMNVCLGAISKAVGSKGLVLFVSDACHSGDNDREEKDNDAPDMRGIIDRFIIPGQKAAYAGRRGETENWVRISACRDFQNNYEVELGGIRYGRLSYAISKAFVPGVSMAGLVRSIEEIYDQLPVKSGRPRQRLDSSVPDSMKDRKLKK